MKYSFILHILSATECIDQYKPFFQAHYNAHTLKYYMYIINTTVNREIFMLKIFVGYILMSSNFRRIDLTYVCFGMYEKSFICSLFVVCDKYEN